MMRYEVSFKCAADIYQYDKELEVGDFVAVQSGKGYNVGVVSRIVPSDTIVTFRENKTQQILNKLTDDRSTIEEMLRAKITFENDALARCRHYCSTHRIGNFIRVIAAEFQFDRKKLTIFVMKAGDASVCKLVRKLFDSFKIRISILDIESPELARHYAIKYIQLSGINLPLNSVYLDPSIIPYVPPTQQLGKSKSSSLQQSLSQFSESMNSQRKYAEYESTPQVHPSVSSSSSLSSSSSSSLNYSQGMIGYSPSTTIHTPYDRNELRFNERGYIPEYSSNYGSNSSGIGIGITGNYRNTVSSFPIPPSSTSTSNYQKGSYPPPLSGHSISSSTPISAPVTTSTTTSLVNEIEEDYYIKDMSRYYSNDINQYLSSQLNQTHLDEADYDEDLPYEQYTTTTTTTTTIPTSTGLKEQHLLQHHHVQFQQQQQQPQQSYHYYRGNEKYSRNSSHYNPEEDLYLRERYIRDTDYPTTSSNTPTTATNTTSNTSLSSSTTTTTINTMGTALNNPSEYHQRDIERYISKVDREYHHQQQQQPSFHHGQQNYSRQSQHQPQHQPVYDDGYHRNVTVENYEHYYKTKTTPSTATTPATIIPSSSLPSTIFSEIYEQNFYKQQQQQSLSSSTTTTTRGPNINLNRVPNQYSIASTPNVNSYNNNTNTNITTHSNNNNNNNNSPTTNINNTTNTMINNNNSNNNSNNINTNNSNNNNNNTYITLNSNNVNNSSTERDYVNFSNESVSLISTSFGAVNVPPDNLFTSSISRASILESNNNNTSNNINNININNTNKNILTYNNNNNINSNNNSNNPLNPSTNNPINSNLSMNSNDYHSTTLPTQVDSNYNNSNNNNNNMISSTSSMSS